MALLEVVNDLRQELDLSARSIEMHAVYLAGAQTPEVQDALRTVMFFDGPPSLAQPKDPDNASEFGWRLGWYHFFQQSERKGIEPTRERLLGTLAASGLYVMDRLYEATGQYVTLQTPNLYHQHFPSHFND